MIPPVISSTGGEPRRTAAWELLLCAVLLMATLLNYADRQALPAAAVAIKTDLGLNNEQYGKVEGIFGLAFGVGALVGGALADWFSVRRLYPAAMLVWSAAGGAPMMSMSLMYARRTAGSGYSN